MDKYAIIVAGGSGSRMGTNVPKQFLMLLHKPVIWYSIEAFLNAFNDIRIILVLPEIYLEQGNNIMQLTSSPESIEIVAGGSSRFQSVQHGLERVPMNCAVFVHDGVRCLLTPQLIHRCYEATLAKGNAIPAVPAIDTLRMETANGSELLDRTKVKIVQTPQTFISDTLIRAYRQDYRDSFTDDASVVESLGEKIYLVAGETTNIKITHHVDMLLAEQILISRNNT